MKTFQINYKGHQVRVENSLLGERLVVDSETQDEQRGCALRSRLWGRIRNGDGTTETIKVSLGGWLGTHCCIFIDDKLVHRNGVGT
jgi:hypothetical protein